MQAGGQDVIQALRDLQRKRKLTKRERDKLLLELTREKWMRRKRTR